MPMFSKSNRSVRLLSLLLSFLCVSFSYAQSAKNLDSAKVRNNAINAVAQLDQNNHYTDFLTPADLKTQRKCSNPISNDALF
jgi:hypothetical protein